MRIDTPIFGPRRYRTHSRVLRSLGYVSTNQPAYHVILKVTALLRVYVPKGNARQARKATRQICQTAHFMELSADRPQNVCPAWPSIANAELHARYATLALIKNTSNHA